MSSSRTSWPAAKLILSTRTVRPQAMMFGKKYQEHYNKLVHACQENYFARQNGGSSNRLSQGKRGFPACNPRGAEGIGGELQHKTLTYIPIEKRDIDDDGG